MVELYLSDELFNKDIEAPQASVKRRIIKFIFRQRLIYTLY